MNLDLDSTEALEVTLRDAGVEFPHRPLCIAYGGADVEQNRKVHEKTNEILLELLVTGHLGTCIHVTGEMRALLDPLHRQICLEMFRANRRGFQVIFDVPEAKRHDPESIVAWSLSRWSVKNVAWKEQLRTVDVIGDRAVDIRASSTLNQIQYSVFGHRYVLLQAKHNDLAEAKQLWLLESESLNEALTEKAQALFAAANDVDEGGYRRFMLALNGVASRFALRELGGRDFMSRPELIADTLECFESDAVESVAALESMGFVERTAGESLCITPKGRDYLSLLTGSEAST